MTTINAKNLTLAEVHRLLKIEKLPNGFFSSLLSLEPLTQFEQQEITHIRNDFNSYLIEGILEGLVKALTTFPLLRLAGYYKSPLKLNLEQDIADIVIIEDEDTFITGRLDIVAINETQKTSTDVKFWVLVIESKNSSIVPSAGLPQLLTYAYKSLESQQSI